MGRRAVVRWCANRAVQGLLSERGALEPGRFRVGVYFADSDVNIYQMRQWYAPLRSLARRFPVLVIARDASGTRAIAEESGLDVVLAPQPPDIERVLAEQPLEVILYVNQNTRNFQMLRYGRRWHVFINHGESDKMYMTTNQHKTYDRAFVAGDAARERLGLALWDYDVDERTVAIGRPQNDHLGGEAPYPVDDRTVVLYAPTWEGDRPAARYGSVRSHGVELVRRLVETGRHRVVYRPHPRTGVVDQAFGRASAEIVAILREANRHDSSAHHVVDDSAQIDWQLRDPDIAICDVSAMVYDRLATGKPLMITRPVARAAEVEDDRGYLADCDWLTVDEVPDIVAAIERALHDEHARDRLGTWSEHYFGDTSPGAPTARFESAVAELIDRADEYRARTSDPDRV
ncbi:glycosyl transferase [Leucobacter sp. Psy1]|nr:glycosyl transferase [Leucobacter sp. Psy1]